MLLPNYKGNNIVNLMTSILNNFGSSSNHIKLDIMPKNFYGSENVVLIIIDGLGYNFLLNNSKLLDNFIVGKMNTVFPTTTTAAITTFNTGLTPIEHGMISWFMNIKELGISGVALTGKSRLGTSLKADNKEYDNDFNLIGTNTIYDQIKAKSYIVQDKSYKNGNYNKNISKGIKKYIGISNFNEGLVNIKKLLLNKERKYIYFYCGDLDNFFHENGVNSKKSKEYFHSIEKTIFNFLKELEKLNINNTSIIITGDHGQIDSPKNKRINLRKFKGLDKLFAIKPNGDSRVLNLFIRLGKEKEFLEYFNSNMKKYFNIFSYKEAVDTGIFGFGKESNKFYDRIGDYILLAKEDYVIGNFLDNEIEHYNIGNHSGLSEDELYVPLIYSKYL